MDGWVMGSNCGMTYRFYTEGAHLHIPLKNTICLIRGWVYAKPKIMEAKTQFRNLVLRASKDT